MSERHTYNVVLDPTENSDKSIISKVYRSRREKGQQAVP
jgi:hypothetical protein